MRRNPFLFHPKFRTHFSDAQVFLILSNQCYLQQIPDSRHDRKINNLSELRREDYVDGIFHDSQLLEASIISLSFSAQCMKRLLIGFGYDGSGWWLGAQQDPSTRDVSGVNATQT
jgi:hypothetical protein